MGNPQLEQQWKSRRGRVEKLRLLPGGTEALVDEAAEDAVISLLVLDGAAMVARCAKAQIGAEAFSSAPHRIVFGAVLRLIAKNAPIDSSILAVELRESGELERIGLPMLTQMTSALPTSLQAGYYLERVRALAIRRMLFQAAKEIQEAAISVSLEGSEVDEFCAEQEAKVLAIVRARVGAARLSKGQLPQIMLWGNLIGTQPRPEPPQLVENLIHRGGKVMLGGGSKSFKTWVLLAMALAIATGRPWWGMRTTIGKVLFVNFELQTWSFEARVRSICQAMGVELNDPLLSENFVCWHMRGFVSDLTELVPQFLMQTVGSQYAAIILDPIYKCLGDRDENANGEVAGLLNEVEALAVRSDAAVIFGHHFSKGNQAAKDARDRVSGAGAWTRDPDTVITLTPHAEEDCFSAEFVLRDLKPRAPMVVRWQHPCMLADRTLDPSQLRQPGRPNEHTVEALIEILRGNKWTYSEFERAAKKEKKMSESTFKRKLKEGVDSGRIEQLGGVYGVE